MLDRSGKNKKLQILKKILPIIFILLTCFGIYKAVDFFDMNIFWQILRSYSLGGIFLMVALSFIAPIFIALRLKNLFEIKLSFTNAFNGVLLANGYNNIMPAKIGEAIKGYYLHKAAHINTPELFMAIIYERFADINLLVILILYSLSDFYSRAYIYVAAGIIFISWCILFYLGRYKKDKTVCSRDENKSRLNLMFQKISDMIMRYCALMVKHPKKIIISMSYSLIIWVIYVLTSVFNFNFVAGLNLSLYQCTAVFTASAVGLVVPNAPGGLGVYEAAMISALMLFGVPKEEALAVSILSRGVQFIPSVIAAVLVTIFSKVRIRDAM